jgi:diguanylate cyclase (GGDEF)-like protein/PAS domain S-box-containing protein
MRRIISVPIYVGLTCALAAAVGGLAMVTPLYPVEWAWWGAVLLFATTLASEAGAVPIPTRMEDEPYIVSIATIPHLACALLLPAPIAALVAGSAMLLDELRGRRGPSRVLFNTACTTTSVGLAALVANSLGLVGGQLGGGTLFEVLAFLLVAATYYVVNTVVVAGIGALASGQSFVSVFVGNARFTAPAEFAIAVLGGLAAFVWVKNPFWFPVGLVPAAVSQLTFRYIAASNRKATQLAALDRLGRALSASLTPEETFRAASAHLRGGRSVEGTFLWLAGPAIDLAEGLAEMPLRRELAERVLVSGAPVVVHDAAQELPEFSPGGASWLGLPLGDGVTQGCLGIVAARARAFGQEDIDFFRLVAERISLALENTRRAAELLTVESEQRVLRRSEERFRSLIRNAADVILILDGEGAIGYQSPAAGRIWGYQPEALTRTSMFALIHPEDGLRAQTLFARVVEQPETNVTGDLRLRHADGSWRHSEVIVTNLLADTSVGGIVATFRDITERRTFEDKLSHLAFHDPLTGLPNRALFVDRLEQALKRADRHSHSVAVLFLDLDNFKVVNDSLGHQAGDRLLVTVAERLTGVLRVQDTVARLGGDEFTVLLEDIRDETEAADAADRLAAALRTPVALGEREIFVTASIGVALSTTGRDQPEDLLRNADLAMYRAKTNGRARHEAFDQSLEENARERLEVETALRLALERGEFQVYYQPILSLTEGRVVEVEALVRWARPGRDLVPPIAFISLAEENGLIVPIGQWVLEQACLQARAWQEQFPSDRPLVMSVNLSARQFQHPALVSDIQRAIRQAGLDPHTLKLEITESVLMQDPDAAVAKLQILKGLGIQLAIDDFGTGYSSLSQLKRLPVDCLKIDRAFVDGLGQDPHDTAIVEAVIALAKTLSLTVTGEGIETTIQRAHLQRLACDEGQGYLFARPLPAADLEPLLARSAAGEERDFPLAA